MKNAQPSSPLLTLAYFAIVFIFGLFFDMLGLRLLAFSAVSLAVYIILITPYRWALFSLFIYIGLEGFFKVVSNYNPVIHVGSDILVITLCIKVLFQMFFLGGLKETEYPPFTRGFIIHFTWISLVMFNPYSLSFISSIAGSKIYISMFLLYFFGYYQVNSYKDIRFFMIPFIIIAVIHTITGIYQGFHGPAGLIALHPRYAVQLLKYKDVAFRPFGLTNLPGGPSVYMYQVFPFLLYFLFYFRSALLRLSIVAYLPMATFLFFLCQVRSALFKMIVASALFVMGVLHASSTSSVKVFQRVIMISSAVLLVINFGLPSFFQMAKDARGENEAAIERSLSLFDYAHVSNARRGAWDRFILYVSEVPFGAGFARVGAAAGAFKKLHKQDKIFGYKHFFTDNFWLAALVEIGIPGMTIITFLFVGILIAGIRFYFSTRNEEAKLASLAVLTPLIALAMGLYGAEGLIYNPEACFFWFWAGVLMKIPKLAEQERVEHATS